MRLLGAILGNDIARVADLLKRPDVDINEASEAKETPLMVCAASGRWEIARLLLRHGGVDFSLRDLQGFCSFTRLALHRIPELVPDYIAAGADVNSVNQIDGRSSLHLAVANQDLEMVEILLEFEADMHQADLSGETALAAAERIGWGALGAWRARQSLAQAMDATAIRRPAK